MSGAQVVFVRLDQIDNSDRLRAIDNEAVKMLAASMQVGDVKRLLQPITVRPLKRGFKLVTGAHRLEAARSLGWDDIACIVEEGLKEDDARIREIDENLHRQELSPYDQAEFITMRWRLWLKKNDKRAKLPQLAELAQGAESKDFYEETAGLAGVHPETIRRAVLRRRQLDHVWADLRGTDAAKKGALLDRLRKLKFGIEDVVAAAGDHGGNVEAALNAEKANRKAKPPSAAQVLKALAKAWKACPAAKRADFVEANAEEIISLLKSRGMS
jgi:ParB family chromosome partitioning protein